MIHSEGFRDSIKMIGKTAVLFCVFGLAGLGVLSCSSDEDGCNHVYGEWTVEQVADADHIGKKHRNCSKCNLSDVVDDASQFVSHVCGSADQILDKDGYVRYDVNADGIDNDYYGAYDAETNKTYYDVENSNEECQCNLKARDENDVRYGKKHQHYLSSDEKSYIGWDMNGNGKYGDNDDLRDGPYKFKTALGTVVD